MNKFEYPEHPSREPSVGELWRSRDIDAYVKVLQIDNGVVTAEASDISIYGSSYDGPPITVDVGTFTRWYRPAVL